MKRMYTAIIMLATAVLIGIACIVTTSVIARNMTKDVQKLYDAAQGNTLPEISQVEELSEKWERRAGIVALYTRHNEVERVTESVDMLKPALLEKDATAFRTECIVVINSLRHMKETEMPKLRNIM